MQGYGTPMVSPNQGSIFTPQQDFAAPITPLQGADLLSIRQYAQTGQMTPQVQALQQRLGPGWNTYLNAYGGGGVQAGGAGAPQSNNPIASKLSTLTAQQIQQLTSQFQTPQQWASAYGLSNVGLPMDSWDNLMKSIGYTGVAGAGAAPSSFNSGWGSVAPQAPAAPTPPATPPAGTPGSTTIGNLATGNGIPAAPGNPYTLNVNDYLNPLMGYALKTGSQAIENSAAARGNLQSGDTARELMQYGMGVGANNWNNAANLAQGQQQFAYGVDNNDRQFDFLTHQQDFTNNFNVAQALANQGQFGLGNQSTAAARLAAILSGNAAAAGQAQGAGTIGGGNALVQAILSSLYGGG